MTIFVPEADESSSEEHLPSFPYQLLGILQEF